MIHPIKPVVVSDIIGLLDVVSAFEFNTTILRDIKNSYQGFIALSIREL